MRYTTETFVESAIKKHGQKYDYSQLEYSSKNPLKIICLNHGAFYVKSMDHLYGGRNKNGFGCPTCGKNLRKQKTIERNISGKISQDEFLKRAKEKHGELYDYSKTIFNGMRLNLKITCAKHGEFLQMAQAHIHNGQGCPACFKEHRRKTLSKKSFGVEEVDFVEKADVVHNEKYDYSQTDLTIRYLGGTVSVICQEHGKFYVRPSNHLKGAACPKCSFRNSAEKTAAKNRLTCQEFIDRAKIIHDEKYSYKNTVYIGQKYKIIITCPTHGDFNQGASDHLSGNGCQKCANFATSKMENDWLLSKNIQIKRKCIKINNRRFYVDGYDAHTNTVYEFLGDYWHGNPERYDPNDYNQRSKKKFGKLYEDTMMRLDLIRSAGYKVEYIWEKDWLNENNLQTRRSARRS